MTWTGKSYVDRLRAEMSVASENSHPGVPDDPQHDAQVAGLMEKNRVCRECKWPHHDCEKLAEVGKCEARRRGM